MLGQGKVTKNSSASIGASLDYVLKSAEDQYHASILEMSRKTPILLVFLRQFGCCFAREALSDIHFSLGAIEAAGARLVLVHMSTEEEASQILASYGLADISRISNQDQSLYKSFGLGRGGLDQLFAPRVLARAIEAMLHGNPLGLSSGDGLQMPGLFLIQNGKVMQAFVPESLDARPDYIRIASGSYPVARV